MFVQTEITPNPNALKFLPGKIVSEHNSFEVTEKEQTNNEASESIRNYDWSYAIPMQDTQKIKINQIHYLDHPFIGIILKVTNETE